MTCRVCWWWGWQGYLSGGTTRHVGGHFSSRHAPLAQACLWWCEAGGRCSFASLSVGVDVPQFMDCDGSATRVVRSVAWASTAFGPLTSGFSWSAVSAPSVSAAAKDSSGTSDHPEERPNSATFPIAEFARRCNRCSTRQSHRARSRDQCPRHCRRGNVDIVARSFAQAKQSAHVHPVGERLDTCHQFIERAPKSLAKADADLLKLQTERAQLATELAEGQARFKALRTEAGAVPTTPAAPKDLASELQRMQGLYTPDRRASAGTFFRSEWMGARQDSHGFGDDGRHPTRSARMEALSRRSRKQTTSCGGWVEFCLLVSPTVL